MSDLSQRLRECAETEYDCDQFSPETVSAMEEAADEIDRLRTEVAELRGALRSVLIDASNVTGQAWEDIREKAHAILAKTAPPKTAPPGK